MTGILAWLAQRKQTIPTSHSSFHTVQITHPFHPLRGQTVEVLYIYQRQPEPDLFIQCANGMTLCVGMSWTDYAGSSEVGGKPRGLLTWQSLREISRFIERRQGQVAYAMARDHEQET